MLPKPYTNTIIQNSHTAIGYQLYNIYPLCGIVLQLYITHLYIVILMSIYTLVNTFITIKIPIACSTYYLGYGNTTNSTPRHYFILDYTLAPSVLHNILETNKKTNT